MRVLLWMLAFLTAFAWAWEKEDHEIFDLVTAIEGSEGKGTTFYSWLGVEASASTQDIAKAYRKLSMQLHPDKNRGDKTIEDRFARLGVVSTILRNKESRKRYDFFHKNGVPIWRGTGYYYSRFRPGVGTVVVFLALLTSAMQYAVQTVTYKTDLERVNRFIREARLAAWGANLVPVQGQRKVRVSPGGPGRMDENGRESSGRMIDLVVDEENVYILDSDSGELHVLDASAAVAPSVTRLWTWKLVTNLFHTISSQFQSKAVESIKTAVSSENLDSDEAYSSTASEATGRPLGPATKVAGGRRRKVVPKRR